MDIWSRSTLRGTLDDVLQLLCLDGLGWLLIHLLDLLLPQEQQAHLGGVSPAAAPYIANVVH